jgi:hypothetical protein
MQQRRRILFTLAVLAALVQILAPALVLRFAAAAAAGDVIAASLCAHDERGGLLAPSPGPASMPSHGTCCPFCVMGSGALPALATPPQAFALLLPNYHRIDWTVASIDIQASPRSSHGQPRAPPLFS